MSKTDVMVQKCIDICNDDNVGYSQRNRWLDPDIDCSSFMYICANLAGYNVPWGSGWTGSMIADFSNAGFEVVEFDGNIYDLEPGDIMLHTQNHTEMYVGNGCFGGAHCDENGDIQGWEGGDQTGNEVSIVNAYIPSYGWEYVLIPPRRAEESTPTTPTVNDIDELAKRVIAGEFGNGEERRQALGDKYDAVQTRVNEMIYGSAPSGATANINELANRVIRGEFGNGQKRRDALGDLYDEVQARVNELLS